MWDILEGNPQHFQKIGTNSAVKKINHKHTKLWMYPFWVICFFFKLTSWPAPWGQFRMFPFVYYTNQIGAAIGATINSQSLEQILNVCLEVFMADDWKRVNLAFVCLNCFCKRNVAWMNFMRKGFQGHVKRRYTSSASTNMGWHYYVLFCSAATILVMSCRYFSFEL